MKSYRCDEKWRPVVGYEGLYEVSNLGRVRGLDRLDSLGREVKGCIRKLGTDKDGYKQVCLTKDRKQKLCKVHRLVSVAFIGDPEGMQVNHIDEDKTNNRVDNLEYVTAMQNTHHGTGILRRVEAFKRSMKTCRPVLQIDPDGTIINRYDSAKRAGESVGTASTSISACCRGKRKTAAGFRWEYENKEAL